MIHPNGPPVGIIASKTSLGCEFSISRIICPNNPSWFITPDNQFKVESVVWLKGNSEWPLWANRVWGVGKEYIMFDVSDTRDSVPMKIIRIIAPFSPFYLLPLFQCLLFWHFHGFLKTRAYHSSSSGFSLEILSRHIFCSLSSFRSLGVPSPSPQLTRLKSLIIVSHKYLAISSWPVAQKKLPSASPQNMNIMYLWWASA